MTERNFLHQKVKILRPLENGAQGKVYVVQRQDTQQKAVLKIFSHSKWFHYLNEKKALQKIKERDITHFGFPELYSYRECLGAHYEVLISCFGRNLKQA